jgi:threonine aldolase
MLSYAEHGKFRLPTQGRQPRNAAKKTLSCPDPAWFCDIPHCEWIMGCACAQWLPVLQSPQYSLSHALTACCGLRHSCNRPFRLRTALSAVNFASDNTAGVAPAILDAIVAANEGYARGYGNDDWTQRVERRLSEIFERDVAIFLVPTGTAANALALAQVTPPWGVVLCHEESHIVTDECGAPEFFGSGLKLAGLPGEAGKVAPATLQAALALYAGHSPHQMIPSALSITQASEAGTIYRTGEIANLCEIARARSLAVHMDGARFANALVRLNASPAEMTWRSGIDVLSFGATKGGALAAEAVVFFDPARAAFMGERRKRAGHLLSKHRFIAAQFLAYLEDDRWLALARHANAMADRLARELAAAGLKPVFPVEANLVFVVLPRALDAKLKAAGASYYVRSREGLDAGADSVLVRLVTSFATQDEDIERFVGLCKKS